MAGDSEDNPLLLRIFLCASRSLKKHRYETMSNTEDFKRWREIYKSIHMPRFVWVCELYSLQSINDPDPQKRMNSPTCIGEIVIDATTTNSHKSYDISNVISINYPMKIAFRSPDDDEDTVIKMLRDNSKDSCSAKLFPSGNWRTFAPFRFDDERIKKKRIIP